MRLATPLKFFSIAWALSPVCIGLFLLLRDGLGPECCFSGDDSYFTIGTEASAVFSPSDQSTVFKELKNGTSLKQGSSPVRQLRHRSWTRSDGFVLEISDVHKNVLATLLRSAYFGPDSLTTENWAELPGATSEAKPLFDANISDKDIILQLNGVGKRAFGANAIVEGIKIPWNTSLSNIRR